jgi:hypothetical protein
LTGFVAQPSWSPAGHNGGRIVFRQAGAIPPYHIVELELGSLTGAA